MEPGRDAWELLQQVWMTKGPGTIRLPVDPIAIGQDLEIEILDDELSPEVVSVLRKDPASIALGHYSYCIELGLDASWEFVVRREFLSATDRDDDQA